MSAYLLTVSSFAVLVVAGLVVVWSKAAPVIGALS